MRTITSARKRRWLLRLAPLCWYLETILALLRPLWFPVVALGRLLLYWDIRSLKVGEYAGITLSDGWGADRITFRRVVEDALRLIEAHDPRRFARLRQDLRYIKNLAGATVGEYQSIFRICRIDFTWYPTDSSVIDDNLARWITVLVATVLVHEGAHARLDTLGIPYGSDNWHRVELYCYREECRFLARLPAEYAAARDEMPTNFNERAYRRRFRKSRWQMLRETLARINKKDSDKPQD